MAATNIQLGGIGLDDASFEWVLLRNGLVPQVIIRQGAERAAEFKALPYITTLSFSCSAVDGVAHSPAEAIVMQGVRILEVREVNDLVCEIYLSNCLADLANAVCPSSFQLLWKDGYLNGTELPLLEDAIKALAEQVTALDANLAAGGFENSPTMDLPDGLNTAGRMLIPAMVTMADSVGADLAVGADGLIYFEERKARDATFPINSYSWVEGMLPTWQIVNRQQRGLPQKIRIYYQEKHAIRVQFPVGQTVVSNELRVELQQVYAFGEDFVTLNDLLDNLGIGRVINDAQIGEAYFRENFDGTGLERDGSAERDEAIAIIKRDYRKLFKIVYPNSVGRIGGWTDLAFGYFKQVRDKDGRSRFTQDSTAAPVRAEWFEWLKVAEWPDPGEQRELAGSIVGRNHEAAGDLNPDAPFTASWVDPNDNVLRIQYEGTEDNTALAWLGLNVKPMHISGGEVMEDDSGVHFEHKFGLHIPTLDEAEFTPELNLDVFLVGTRRLPNTAAKWTSIEIDAFPEGDIEFMEVEVGSELFAIRDYVDAASGRDRQGDGLGELKNQPELQIDAERRAAIILEEIGAALEGKGTAQGLAPAIDFGRTTGAIRELAIEVDEGLVITTQVSMGNLDSVAARSERRRIRERQRAMRAGGRDVA